MVSDLHGHASRARELSIRESEETSNALNLARAELRTAREQFGQLRAEYDQLALQLEHVRNGAARAEEANLLERDAERFAR